MTTFALALAVVLTATPAAPQAEVRNVRIYAPKMQVSREKAGTDVTVGGQIRVDMHFARKTARKPVLRLVCLCEAEDGLSVRTILLDRPRTSNGLARSEILAAFKNAGVEIPYKERDATLSDPAKFTPYLSEVSKEPYASAVYGTADVKHGFFRLGRAQTLPKVLLTRIELWQNGVRVADYDSSRSGLGGHEIPEDWYLWRKYPQKFKYADVR